MFCMSFILTVSLVGIVQEVVDYIKCAADG